MKISVPRSVLQTDLASIIDAVITESTLPVLRCVLFDAQANTETFITGTNLDAYLTFRLPSVRVAVPGKIALPAELLLNVLKAMEFATVSETILIEAAGNLCTINCGAITVTLDALPAEEFPNIPAIVNLIRLELDSETFSYALRDLLPAASLDETRFPLCVLGFQGKGETLRLAATNGRVAVVRKIATPFTGEKSIPLPAALILAKLLPSVGQCEFLFDDSKVRISRDRFTFTTKLVESLFPFAGIDELLAASAVSTLKLDRNQTLSALHVLLCGSSEQNAGVVFTPTADGDVLASRTDATPLMVKIRIRGTLSDSKIILNGYYLRTIFNAIPDSVISLAFTLLQGFAISEDGQTQVMIAPMRR